MCARVCVCEGVCVPVVSVHSIHRDRLRQTGLVEVIRNHLTSPLTSHLLNHNHYSAAVICFNSSFIGIFIHTLLCNVSFRQPVLL